MLVRGKTKEFYNFFVFKAGESFLSKGRRQAFPFSFFFWEMVARAAADATMGFSG